MLLLLLHHTILGLIIFLQQDTLQCFIVSPNKSSIKAGSGSDFVAYLYLGAELTALLLFSYHVLYHKKWEGKMLFLNSRVTRISNVAGNVSK